MKKITYNLPRVAVATKLIDSLIQSTLENNTEDLIVLVDGHDCVVTNQFFVDYFRSELKRFPQVKKVLVSQGPPQLQDIVTASNTYTILEFRAMVDTIEKNIVQNIDSYGEYVSVTYEVKDVELLAIALLERGFKLESIQEKPG